MLKSSPDCASLSAAALEVLELPFLDLWLEQLPACRLRYALARGGGAERRVARRLKLPDPRGPQREVLLLAPVKRGIRKNYTPSLLILQGMTLQLQGIALPPF